MDTLYDSVKREAGRFHREVRELPVTPRVSPGEIRRHLEAQYDFGAPVSADKLLTDVSEMLRRWTLHATHPRYFGLFNPSVVPVTVAADALAALYNPQLAVWRHAPAANEIERHVLRFLMSRIGFDPDTSVAHFTSGGQEANMTSVVVALTRRFPEFGEEGLRSVSAQPVIYLSEESHHSFHKVAGSTGLGRKAIRLIPTDRSYRLDPDSLERAVTSDRKAGLQPFMVVATAGTTSAGVVDPLVELAEASERQGLWLHVDAAWGGSALLSERLRACLEGIERADSITWDAHKWLSVPLGAGMFFCRRPQSVSDAFRVSASNYVPPGQEGTLDNYATTMQWSRRFIGLKLFMALAELGAEGYRTIIDHQARMADLLREKLVAAGCRILNETPLPVVCFTHPAIDAKQTTTTEVVTRVLERGRSWISEVRLPGGVKGLRACITSYRTNLEDLEVLVEDLDGVFAD